MNITLSQNTIYYDIMPSWLVKMLVDHQVGYMFPNTTQSSSLLSQVYSIANSALWRPSESFLRAQALIKWKYICKIKCKCFIFGCSHLYHLLVTYIFTWYVSQISNKRVVKRIFSLQWQDYIIAISNAVWCFMRYILCINGELSLKPGILHQELPGPLLFSEVTG